MFGLSLCVQTDTPLSLQYKCIVMCDSNEIASNPVVRVWRTLRVYKLMFVRMYTSACNPFKCKCVQTTQTNVRERAACYIDYFGMILIAFVRWKQWSSFLSPEFDKYFLNLYAEKDTRSILKLHEVGLFLQRVKRYSLSVVLSVYNTRTLIVELSRVILPIITITGMPSEWGGWCRLNHWNFWWRVKN